MFIKRGTVNDLGHVYLFSEERMYGLVNQGLKDMVCLDAGQDTWMRICQQVGLSHHDFDLMEPYDDALTAKLVAEIAAELNIDGPEVLTRFGKYWIKFTAHQGYGQIMDLFGKDFKTCLKNLNRMHGHMGSMMPGLKPPRFTVVDRGSSTLEIQYSSTRKGLAPMVHGLLIGLAEKFNEKAEIKLLLREPDDESDRFLVELGGV
jgi:hypothetical protein